MRPVRGSEGVVDVNIAQCGKLFGEFRIVGFFFGVKAQVFRRNYPPAARTTKAFCPVPLS